MDSAKISRARGPGVTAAVLALLLVACLVDSTTEQRINSRGSKSGLVERINGWRSQRGGSCLSYGHSCWGAHGKRSSRPPVTAPDWYLSRMLRRIASNAELSRTRQIPARNNDLSAIFQVDVPNETPDTETLPENQDMPTDTGSRAMEAKPMLDDELLSKIKLWQIMRDASENN